MFCEKEIIKKRHFCTPFGQIHSSSGSLSNPYQYVGEEGYYTEEDTGLQLLGQRWYDAEVGRFISRDPIFSSPIFLMNLENLYSFASNNPTNEVDPSGLHSYIREVVFTKMPDFSSIKDPCDSFHIGTIIAVQIGGFNKWQFQRCVKRWNLVCDYLQDSKAKSVCYLTVVIMCRVTSWQPWIVYFRCDDVCKSSEWNVTITP